MVKGKEMKTDFEHHVPDEDSGRGFGFMATIAILTIVGVIVWFMLSRGETN